MPRNFEIIIVTYNSEGVIMSCLKSLNNLIDKVCVIDNASEDGTIPVIKKYFPKARLTVNKTNFGFAKAVNIGIKKSRGDVLLVNPDTKCSDNLVKILRKVAYSDKNIAAVAPKILNDDNSLQPNCGNFPTAFNLLLDKLPFIKKLIPISHLIRNSYYYNSSKNPDWIAGTCMYIKRDALDKIGNLDESYFMYGEDIDWCYKAKQKGYKVAYTPEISIFHSDDGRKKTRYSNKFYNIRKGFLLFFKKYNKKKDFCLFILLLKLELFYNKFIEPKSKKWQNTYNNLEILINENLNNITSTA